MCLYLTAIPAMGVNIPSSGTLTVYKVFSRRQNYLRSPYFDYRCIAPGVQIAEIPWPESFSQTDVGQSFDVSGFHCIITHEEAKAYEQELYKRGDGQIVIERDQAATDTHEPSLVVVPIVINVEDILAIGETRLMFGPADRTSVKTYVVKSFTISPEAFEAAMYEEIVKCA